MTKFGALREKMMEKVGGHCCFQDLMREERGLLKGAFSAFLFVCTLQSLQNVMVTGLARRTGKCRSPLKR